MVINSPNYPMNYKNSTKCSWDIVVPHKRIIRFQVLEFKTEWRHDWLSFRSSQYSPSFATVLHGDNVSHILIRSNEFIVEYTQKVLLEFRSDCLVTNKGFKIKYSLIGRL